MDIGGGRKGKATCMLGSETLKYAPGPLSFDAAANEQI